MEIKALEGYPDPIIIRSGLRQRCFFYCLCVCVARSVASLASYFGVFKVNNKIWTVVSYKNGSMPCHLSNNELALPLKFGSSVNKLERNNGIFHNDEYIIQKKCCRRPHMVRVTVSHFLEPRTDAISQSRKIYRKHHLIAMVQISPQLDDNSCVSPKRHHSDMTWFYIFCCSFTLNKLGIWHVMVDVRTSWECCIHWAVAFVHRHSIQK